ncbi:L,D-transpeptidase family protein [Jiella sp. CQZ9-1]|uniref:L,D-transpeptidase family protein n=1 Tax=Jiella flava TaxID=2816857 RepID=A0A939JVB3_9HYPH|nr:L,D-transpeptidase family protein [Jiella flava]
MRHLIVRRKPGETCRGILAAGPFRIPCALGRSGTTIGKREGDGATPVATMALVELWHRGGRMARPKSRLAIRRIRPGVDGWCDAPDHPAYNRPVRLPFAASAETLAREDRLYDVVIVLDYNYRRRARGLGSAIFFHVAEPGHPPTAGCIAIAPADMRKLAPFLSGRTTITVKR